VRSYALAGTASCERTDAPLTPALDRTPNANGGLSVSRTQVAPVEQSIFTVRGRRIILSADLAQIYDVEVRVLNQAVKRNQDRFPDDFAFRLTRSEALQLSRLRSQSVILKRGQHLKYPPLAFTEHGAIMAASVLNSPRAAQMSIHVVRAFLRLREWVAGQAELSKRLAELEAQVGAHDTKLMDIIVALREFVQPPEAPRRRIGFRLREVE